jgi:hypothetical protein
VSAQADLRRSGDEVQLLRAKSRFSWLKKSMLTLTVIAWLDPKHDSNVPPTIRIAIVDEFFDVCNSQSRVPGTGKRWVEVLRSDGRSGLSGLGARTFGSGRAVRLAFLSYGYDRVDTLNQSSPVNLIESKNVLGESVTEASPSSSALTLRFLAASKAQLVYKTSLVS